MRRFQVIRVVGDTPYACGEQYGRQAREKIQAGVAVYRDYFEKTSGRTWQEIKKYAASYLPLLEEAMPPVVQEARGIAEGAQVSMEELMVLNCRYEILKLKKKPAQPSLVVNFSLSPGSRSLNFISCRLLSKTPVMPWCTTAFELASWSGLWVISPYGYSVMSLLELFSTLSAIVNI